MSFENADVDILTAGVSHYFDFGVLAYKFFHFDQEATTSLATDSDGESHQLQLIFGKERTSGTFDFRFLHGDDFLRQFSSTGEDVKLSTDAAYLSWRRLWTDHFGTFLQVEWSERSDGFERSGGELRIYWRWD